jgi:hypothetical protein
VRNKQEIEAAVEALRWAFRHPYYDDMPFLIRNQVATFIQALEWALGDNERLDKSLDSIRSTRAKMADHARRN